MEKFPEDAEPLIDANDAASDTSSIKSKDDALPWRKPYQPGKADVMYGRLKFYRALNTNSTSVSFEPPPHILPTTLMLPLVPFADVPSVRSSNAGTIFSIATVMLGSTLVVIPWGYQCSGLFGGLILVVGIGLFSFYTSRLIVVHGGMYEDFSDMCKDYIGNIAFYASLMASLVVLLGACMAYHTLMANFAYSVINAVRHSEEATHIWSTATAPVLITAIVFPLTLPKEMKILVRISAFGFVSVLVCLLFICYNSFKSISAAGGLNGAIIQTSSANCPSTQACVPLFDQGWGSFASLLPVSYFCHNCILPIVNNTGDPRERGRNHAIGFWLVAVVYLLVGLIPFIAELYPGHKIFGENYLDPSSFGTFEPFALVTRLALLVQLLTIYPLLVGIIRTQFYCLVLKSAYPSFLHVLVHNIIVVGLTTFIASQFPDKPGQILGYVGAITGTIYVAVLPIAVHLMILRQKQQLTKLSLVWHISLMFVGAFLFFQGILHI